MQDLQHAARHVGLGIVHPRSREVSGIDRCGAFTLRLWPALLLAAVLAPAARAEKIVSFDRLLTVWVSDPWHGGPAGRDPNQVLHIKRGDGAFVRISASPFPADPKLLKARAADWAARLRKRGHRLPAAPVELRIAGNPVFYFRAELRGEIAVHGFMSTPHGSYYIRGWKLEPKALGEALSTLEVRARGPRAFEGLWPDATLKELLARNGAFRVEVPETWVEDVEGADARREALSIKAGEGRFGVEPARALPPEREPLRDAAEAAREAAAGEGMEAGRVESLVLRSGAPAYAFELVVPRSGRHVAGFFAFGGRAYSFTGVGFAMPVVRELLDSVAEPSPERREEAETLAARWGKPSKPGGTPAPRRSAPSRPKRGPLFTANALLVLSAVLGVVGSALYWSETSAEPEAAAAPAPAAPAERPPRPETGPLTIRRRYAAGPDLFEIDGPEGRRFLAESRRSVWYLRWGALLGLVTLWTWGRLLGLEAWPTVVGAKLGCIVAFILSWPVELAFGRRIRLFDPDGRLVLDARRSGVGLEERYRVFDAGGQEVARLSRKLFSRLGGKRWTLLTPEAEEVAALVIESEGSPAFRKLLGHFFGLLRDDLALKLADGTVAGRCLRQGSPLDQGVLEFSDGLATFITTDVLSIAVAAVLVLDPDRPYPWPFG